MTPMVDLIDLADRIETMRKPDTIALRALNREVALAVGWHRYSPSEMRSKRAGWIAPEDFCGEHTTRDGKRYPILDSLHGTDIHREPLDYLWSIDDAIKLIPEGLKLGLVQQPDDTWECALLTLCDDDREVHYVNAVQPAMAIVVASLRSIAGGGQP